MVFLSKNYANDIVNFYPLIYEILATSGQVTYKYPIIINSVESVYVGTKNPLFSVYDNEQILSLLKDYLSSSVNFNGPNSIFLDNEDKVPFDNMQLNNRHLLDYYKEKIDYEWQHLNYHDSSNTVCKNYMKAGILLGAITITSYTLFKNFT